VIKQALLPRCTTPRDQLSSRSNNSPVGRTFSNPVAWNISPGSECATCPWQRPCSGYFKWPDPAYSCEGVKQLFFNIQTAANEIRQDVASFTEADKEILSEPREATP